MPPGFNGIDGIIPLIQPESAIMELEKKCAFCGQLFSPLKHWAIYCSQNCNKAAYHSRKAKLLKGKAEGKSDLDLLDEELNDLAPPSPSEAQITDRERRKEGSEETLEAQRTEKIVQAAEQRLKFLKQNPPSLEDLGYAPKKPET